MENGPLTSYFRIKTSIYRGFSIAMFDYQRVFFAFLMHPMNMRHIAGRDRAAECAARRQSLHKLLCKLLHRLMLILAVALDCSSVLFLFSSGPEWHSSSLEWANWARGESDAKESTASWFQIWDAAWWCCFCSCLGGDRTTQRTNVGIAGIGGFPSQGNAQSGDWKTVPVLRSVMLNAI